MAPCTETSMSFKLLSSFRSLRLPVLLVMLTGHLPLSAQEIPRLSNGLPDFNGVWQVLNEANWDLEPHIARHSVMMREGPVNAVLPQKPRCRSRSVGPRLHGVIEGGGRIPYNEQARRVKEDNAANWITRDPEVKCYMPGVPRATYLPHPFQIIQSENDFFIAYQFAGAVRDIYLEDPGPAPLIPGWGGQQDAGKETLWWSKRRDCTTAPGWIAPAVITAIR